MSELNVALKGLNQDQMKLAKELELKARANFEKRLSQKIATMVQKVQEKAQFEILVKDHIEKIANCKEVIKQNRELIKGMKTEIRAIRAKNQAERKVVKSDSKKETKKVSKK